jgi:hypothetical protein
VILGRIASFPNEWVFALLAVIALPAGAVAEPLLRGAMPGIQTAGPAASQQDAGEGDGEPGVTPGDPTRSRDRDAVIPLIFTPRRDEPAGTIRVELTLPSGPWRFQRAEAPPRSGWKISSRQRRLPAQGSAAPAESTLIELNISAGSKALPGGLIGYLRFRLQDRDSPLPAGVTVGKLETEPPAFEVVAPQAPAGFPGLSNDPSLNPTVTCFFFGH